MTLPAVVAATVFAVPASAHAAKLVVGNQPAACPSAQHTTIQAAVDAAASGDTIAICPGTYVEGSGANPSTALTIAKSLTIRGAGADRVTIRPAGVSITNSTGFGPARFDAVGNIITVTSPVPATPTDVAISGVTIDGGTVSLDSGLAFINATGSLVDSHVTNIDGAHLGAQRGIAVTAHSNQGTGDFPILLRGNLIDHYNKGGVYVTSAVTFNPNVRSGSRVLATIDDTRIDGAGPNAVQSQNGIYTGSGAGTTITDSSISENYFSTDYDESVGVGFFDADLGAGASSITRSTMTGNGYGLVNADAAGVANTIAASATTNWWGSAGGPTDGAIGGTFGAVTSAPVRTSAPAALLVPAQRADTAPGVVLGGPAAGSTIGYGTPTAVTADAADDIAVRAVTFRVGTTVLGTDTSAPYSAAYTPTRAEAGTTQTITATAENVTGQSTSVALGVAVAAVPPVLIAPLTLRSTPSPAVAARTRATVKLATWTRSMAIGSITCGSAQCSTRVISSKLKLKTGKRSTTRTVSAVGPKRLAAQAKGKLSVKLSPSVYRALRAARRGTLTVKVATTAAGVVRHQTITLTLRA